MGLVGVLQPAAALFPLVGEYTLALPRGSTAARLSAESPRALGDALLRALRTARTEEDVVASCASLLRVEEGAATV